MLEQVIYWVLAAGIGGMFAIMWHTYTTQKQSNTFKEFVYDEMVDYFLSRPHDDQERIGSGSTDPMD